MSELEALALALALFLLSQLFAIPLGYSIGKRVSGFRWFLIVVASVAFLYVLVLIQGGQS